MMEWLPSDADMHFMLGFVAGGLIVGAALWAGVDKVTAPRRGRHRGETDERH